MQVQADQPEFCVIRPPPGFYTVKGVSYGGAVVDVQEPAQQEELPPAPVPEPREEIKTVKLCHDTDNGIIRWEEGKVFGFYDNASRFEFSDYCEDNVYLTEYYCENEEPVTRRFQCSNGCRQNHCT